MTVTELALLSIKQPPDHPATATATATKSIQDPSASGSSPNSGLSSTVLTLLHRAATSQATFSNQPVTLLQSLMTPSEIFLLGGWESVRQHTEEWIPGPINQGLMRQLEPYVDVKWMFHLDTEPCGVAKMVVGDEKGGGSGSAADIEGETAGKDSEEVIIARYVIRDGEKETVREALLRDGDGDGDIDGTGKKTQRVSYGWRLDSGYVGENSGAGMKQVEETIVVFTAGAGTGVVDGEKRLGKQSSISEMLAESSVGKDVRSVKVIMSVAPGTVES